MPGAAARIGEGIQTRVAITGSSGLIGSALAASLRGDGHQVIRLARRPARPGTAPGTGTAGPGTGAGAGTAAGPGTTAGDAATRADAVSAWDPESADGGLDPRAFADVAAVVHLAGAGIADRRWTAARKAEIRDSRVRGTRALATGLARLDEPPIALLCGSAIGWYGDTRGQEADESAPPGAGFLAGVVRDWEQAAEPARAAGIRTAYLRTGIVLTSRGGSLGRLLPIFKLGFGIPLGSGTQYLSWISLADEVGAIRFLLDRPDVAGALNLTAPHPVTNSEFTAALNAALGHPAVLRLPVPDLRLPGSVWHVPTTVLRLALGEVSGELLASARVLPRRLLEAGYRFRYPDISSALAYALG